MSGDMTFGILGTLEVRCAGVPRQIPAPHHRALLARLLVRAGESVTVHEIADAVWGDRLPKAPRAALHNLVRRVRGEFQEHVIQTTATGYQSIVAPENIDLYRFRRLVGQARHLSSVGDIRAEAATLRAALQLWRGPALADIPSDSLQSYEVPALTEEQIGATERRIAADLQLDINRDLITELRILTCRYPLRERFWAQLMLALYRDERSAEALATYRQARKTLAVASGIDPGPALQRLHLSILNNDPALVSRQP